MNVVTYERINESIVEEDTKVIRETRYDLNRDRLTPSNKTVVMKPRLKPPLANPLETCATSLSIDYSRELLAIDPRCHCSVTRGQVRDGLEPSSMSNPLLPALRLSAAV